MREDFKNKWVVALRSGEYKQTIGYLGVVLLDGTKAYCCLGVACEVAIKDGLELRVDPNSRPEYAEGTPVRYGGSPEIRLSGSMFDLPNEVRSLAGLRLSDPAIVNEKGRREVLSSLNDVEKLSFNEIADAIEKNWQRM